MDKIKHFANMLEYKGTLSDGFVKQMNTTVLSATLQGELKVKWVTIPVKARMIRISSPLLPHGLIARGNTLRCAIYY
jgi:hypothetical protein